jgi:hypothetical protein
MLQSDSNSWDVYLRHKATLLSFAESNGLRVVLPEDGASAVTFMGRRPDEIAFTIFSDFSGDGTNRLDVAWLSFDFVKRTISSQLVAVSEGGAEEELGENLDKGLRLALENTDFNWRKTVDYSRDWDGLEVAALRDSILVEQYPLNTED